MKKKVIAEETIQDPYSGSIDEFLAEKQNKQSEPNEQSEKSEPSESVQDKAVENLEEETGKDHIEPEQQNLANDPQEHLEEKSEDVQEESAEESLESLEDKKKQLEDRISTLKSDSEKESFIESKLKKIASSITDRGYTSLASSFLKVIGGVPEILNRLLMKEYLILDIMNNYYYLFEGSSLESYKKFDPKEVIKFLQQQIVSLKGVPTIQRLSIPDVNPASAEGIIVLIKEYEKVLITEYQQAIKNIVMEPQLGILKLNLENIVRVKEQLILGA